MSVRFPTDFGAYNYPLLPSVANNIDHKFVRFKPNNSPKLAQLITFSPNRQAVTQNERSQIPLNPFYESFSWHRITNLRLTHPHKTPVILPR